ncbi:MAG: PEGA domain-containing protein [Acidobacteria bacterium]|nr:PEGA domain-containing protein [Acidobacteriota bacterium]
MKSILLLATFTSLALAQVQIPDGTKIRVRLEQPISSATAEDGQVVSLSVADPVRVGNAIVIPQGSAVTGSVVSSSQKRRLGRSGKIDFSIDRVRAIDGQWVTVRYAVTKKDGGNRMLATGVTTGIMAATIWPAAPFFLMMKGKDATIPKGAMFDVFTDDSHLVMNTTPTSPNMYANLVDRQMAQAAGFAPTMPSSANMNGQPVATPMASAGTAHVTVTSSTPGAEIEIDGMFVGSTPSTVQLQAGVHRISVKNASESWERSLQVGAGGSITLNAVFAGVAPAPATQRTVLRRQ